MNQNSSLQKQPSQSFMRWGAYAYFAMPLCYIAMFLIYGLLLSIPQGEVAEKIAYVAAQQSLVSLANVFGYLIFGCLLLIAVQATHTRLSTTKSHLLNFATAFGFIWVVLMMCSGMTALTGIHTMVKLFSQESPHAETLFYVYTTIVNGLGGGIELVGGMWVLIISIYGLKTAQLAKGVHFLGIAVGLLGIFTIAQSISGIKEAFGLSQIVWFICMGVALLKTHIRVES